jgi:hypothetical protein
MTWTLRFARALLFATAPVLFAAIPAFAQAPINTPDKGVIAYGFDAGVVFPDDQFENTLSFDAFGEYYLTPRISTRAMFAWASPGFSGRTEDHFRQAKILVGAAYNWKYKSLRPFAGAGAGAHFVRLKLDGGQDPPGEKRGGIYFGGGSDFILDKESAIKVELRWDVVSAPTNLPDATSATFTVGYKRFF